MPLGDTIAAIAAAPGCSPRTLVRISGPAAERVLGKLVEPSPDRMPVPRPIACAARLALGAVLSLPVLLIRSRAPRSYTGEETAELLIPGNPHLAERVLSALMQMDGVRLASPGEFTARAYLNGRITIHEAEGVAAAIAAESQDQLDSARALLDGSTGRQYTTWLEECATLLALVEAGIDFTDQEDVIPIAPAALGARLDALEAQIADHLGASAGTQAPGTLPRIVLTGSPNAGKSTLFNALLGRPRAVVSSQAGTTRDVLEETLDLSRDLPGGGSVMLIDLAGLDQTLAVGSVDAQAQERARRTINDADVIIYCDPAGRFNLPLKPGRPIIRVRTKADLPCALDEHPPGDASEAISICALDGWNLPTLRRAIADAACGSRSAGVAALLPRHRRTLSESQRSLAEAIAAVDPALPALLHPEVVAGSLRQALDALGELAGRISPDDVIGRIFATFCIGK